MSKVMSPNYDDFRRDFRAYGDEVLRKKKEYQLAMEGSFGERAAAEKEIKGTFSQNAELNKQIHGTFGDRSLLDQWKANLMAGVENRRTAVAEGDLANKTAESKLNQQMGADMIPLNKALNESRLGGVRTQGMTAKFAAEDQASAAGTAADIALRTLKEDRTSRALPTKPYWFAGWNVNSPYFLNSGKLSEARDRYSVAGSADEIARSNALTADYLDKKEKARRLNEIAGVAYPGR